MIRTWLLQEKEVVALTESRSISLHYVISSQRCGESMVMQIIWSTVDTIVKEGTMSMIDGSGFYVGCMAWISTEMLRRVLKKIIESCESYRI